MPLQQTGVLDLLSRLVDKSLVVAEERTGSGRYHMLETIRHYAREKLQESNEGREAHDRHLDYFVKLGAEAELKLRGSELSEWLDRLETEIDNIRSALVWSQETGRIESGLGLATSLFWFWYIRGHRTEGLDWLQSLLAQPAPLKNTAVRGRALCRLASTHDRHRNYDAARLMAEEALAIGQEVRDQPLIASAYGALGEIAFFEGNLALAGSMSDQALAMCRATGDRYQIGSAALTAGFVAVAQGAYVQAEQWLAECVQLMQDFGDKNMLSTADRFWCYALLDQGNDAGAAAKFHESLTLNWELSDKQGVGACLAACASLAVLREDFQHAARLLGATDRVCKSLDQTLLSWDRPFYDRTTRAARAQLDAATFDAAWAGGHALTLEQAIAEAGPVTVQPGAAEAPHAIAAEWGGLSDRERDVALLVAQGLSNREIAETLVLSRRTVETHIANIFNKLGFSTRAQVRQWARDKARP